MGKNIVILCDGTSNEISRDRTNILRLFGTLKKNDDQIVFYDPGVGTFGAENSVSYYYRKAVEIWGLATGWGLDQNVKEAYRFLSEHYDDGKRDGEKVGEPDQIYLFGFSRGAYTARVLAGFIRAIGIISKDNLNLLDYAYRAYKGISFSSDQNGSSNAGSDAFAEIRLFERMLRPEYVPIKLLGLFDTVGSVIESGRHGPRLRSHAFTQTNQNVEHVRHALAIDERRTMFEPQLWPSGKQFWPQPFQPDKAVEQDVKEVWFTGVHADIGGGYPENKSQLAKIALHWMIEEAKALGLDFKTRTVNEIVLGKKEGAAYVSPSAVAMPNESMTLGWSILEYIPRKKSKYSSPNAESNGGWYMHRGRRRSIPDGAMIHHSVFERKGTEDFFAQTNIPADYVKI
nr:DUF2235 domain-containing protein [uncultured Cohaesibacter sp.]